MKLEDIVDKIKVKTTLEEKDLVLILTELKEKDSIETKIGFFHAYIIDITKNSSKRDEWWFVTFRALSDIIHLPEVTWILRTEQMTGQEEFTMQNKKKLFLPLDLSKKQKETKKTKLYVVKDKKESSIDV